MFGKDAVMVEKQVLDAREAFAINPIRQFGCRFQRSTYQRIARGAFCPLGIFVVYARPFLRS